MREHECDSLGVHLEGLEPVSRVFDLFGCLCCSVLELYSSNEFNFSIVIGDGVHP